MEREIAPQRHLSCRSRRQKHFFLQSARDDRIQTDSLHASFHAPYFHANFGGDALGNLHTKPSQNRYSRTISASASTFPTRVSRFVLRCLSSSPAIVFDAIVNGSQRCAWEKRGRPRVPVCGVLTTFRRHRRGGRGRVFIDLHPRSRVAGSQVMARRRARRRKRSGNPVERQLSPTYPAIRKPG